MGQQRTYQGQTYEQQADGTWLRVGGQQGQVIADPGAQADIQQGNAQAQNTAVDARVNAATAQAQIEAARAEAEQTHLENERLRGELARGGMSPDQAVTDRDRVSRLNQLTSQINRVQELFAQGPGATSGLWSAMDYLPSDANSRLDTAGAALSQQGLAAFRVPGTGTVSDRDAAMFDRANLPTASNRDAAIDEQLRGLRARVEEEYQTLGLPTPEWQGAPGPSAMDQTNIIDPATQMQASGSTGRTSTPIPPEMQQEYQAWVLANVGTMTPESYSAFRQGLDQKYNFESGDYGPEAQRMIDGVRNGGTLNLTIPPVDQPMTSLQALDDMVAGSAGGAGMAGFANMGSFGGVEGLLGDQYNAMREANPNTMLGGEIAGTLLPTAGIGGLARMITRRVAPNLLGGGTLAALGRGAATDAAYAGAYGANTGQNPVESAIEGGVGSLIGQGIGRGVGAGLRGVATSAPVQALVSRGIPLTAGQTMGGFVGRMEEKAMSLPGVGDMLRNRRNEATTGLNMAAFRDAGALIGAVPDTIAQAGMEQLTNAQSNAYSGIQFNNGPIPLNSNFLAAMDAAAGAVRNPAGSRRLNTILREHVQPIAEAGQMTSPDYIAARRGLSAARNSVPESMAGYQDRYREGIGMGRDALDNLVMDSGDQQATTRLLAANDASRNISTLEDAMRRAERGNVTGEPYVFNAGQLQAASQAAQRNYPSPNGAPFQDLAENAARVMTDRVPNSGTSDRAMQALLLGGGASGALGGAGGYAAGGDAQSVAGGTAAGIGTPAAIFALMAAASTRTGQRALVNSMTTRNPTVRQFGEQILNGTMPILNRRYGGLFGSAAIPIAMQSEY